MAELSGIAVALIHRRSPLPVAEAVARLREALGPEPRILVVDCASTDGSAGVLADKLSADAGTELLRADSDRGDGAAWNLAVRRATALELDYVLTVESDVEITAAAVATLVTSMKQDDEVAAIGPTLREPDRVVTGGYVRWVPAAVGAGRRALGATSGPEPVAFLPRSCALYRRAALQSIGGFVEDDLLGFEHVDAGVRLRRAGHEVVCVGWATVAVRSRAMPSRLVWTLNTWRLLRRHGSWWARVAFSATALVSWPIAVWGGRGASVAGLVRGWAGRRVVVADLDS